MPFSCNLQMLQRAQGHAGQKKQSIFSYKHENIKEYEIPDVVELIRLVTVSDVNRLLAPLDS